MIRRVFAGIRVASRDDAADGRSDGVALQTLIALYNCERFAGCNTVANLLVHLFDYARIARGYFKLRSQPERATWLAEERTRLREEAVALGSLTDR